MDEMAEVDDGTASDIQEQYSMSNLFLVTLGPLTPKKSNS